MDTVSTVDLILGAVFLFYAIVGAKRGLFVSLTRLLVAAAALLGAGIAATWCKPLATEVLSPLVEKQLGEKIQRLTEQIQALRGGTELPKMLLPEELEQLLQGLQLPGAFLGLGEQVQQRVGQSSADLAQTVVQTLVGSLVYMILFLVFFFLFRLLLNTMVGAMNLVFRLPGLKALNTEGGFLFGLAEAGLWIFLALWVLEWIQPQLLQHYQDQSVLVHFLSKLSLTELLQSLKMPLK